MSNLSVYKARSGNLHLVPCAEQLSCLANNDSKLLKLDGVVHVRKLLGQTTRHFLFLFCSKNSLVAKSLRPRPHEDDCKRKR